MDCKTFSNDIFRRYLLTELAVENIANSNGLKNSYNCVLVF